MTPRVDPIVAETLESVPRKVRESLMRLTGSRFYPGIQPSEPD